YHQYKQEYEKMLLELNSSKKSVTITDFSHVPSFLEPTESEEWSSGLRLFYNKENVTINKP
ncbi:MAG: hypothetical protein IKW28_09160, partial [Lachnospiraceae bacterium]|nr:hypothetical protein [Lachnospiraceae bacterium]